MQPTNRIALVITGRTPEATLLDVLTEDGEIEYLENALSQGERNPLNNLYFFRKQQEARDVQLEEDMEQLLCKAGLNPKIRHQGVQWFISKSKMEKHQLAERKAAEVIAGYALDLFTKNPEQTDFVLVSQKAQVRVQVFIVQSGPYESGSSGKKAG